VHCRERPNQRLLIGIGELRRRNYTPPVGELQLDAGLLQGGSVDRLDPVGPAYGQHSDLSRFYLVQELAVTGCAERDLAAEHGRQQLTATVVGDVVHLLGLDANCLGELHRQQMVRPTGGGAAANCHAFRVRLPVIHQVGGGVVRGVLGGRGGRWRGDQLRKRRGLVERGGGRVGGRGRG